MMRKSIVLLAVFMSLPGIACAQQQRGQAVQLPEGHGKELVEANCATCHRLSLVANAGYSEKDWQEVFSSMVKLPSDQASTIAAYLAKSFPEKSRPQPVLIPGTVNVSIKEWLVPTLGSRPHDPLATADGNSCWTGQSA